MRQLVNCAVFEKKNKTAKFTKFLIELTSIAAKVPYTFLSAKN